MEDHCRQPFRYDPRKATRAGVALGLTLTRRAGLRSTRPFRPERARDRANIRTGGSTMKAALTVVLLSCLLPGCGTVRVQPWERGTLTEYGMRPDRDPLAAAMSEHTFFSREATGGGRAVGGSSCGCN